MRCGLEGIQKEYGRTVRWAVTSAGSDFALIRDLVLGHPVVAVPEARPGIEQS